MSIRSKVSCAGAAPPALGAASKTSPPCAADPVWRLLPFAMATSQMVEGPQLAEEILTQMRCPSKNRLPRSGGAGCVERSNCSHASFAIPDITTEGAKFFRCV